MSNPKYIKHTTLWLADKVFMINDLINIIYLKKIYIYISNHNYINSVGQPGIRLLRHLWLA